MRAEIPCEHVRHRVQISASVVRDHAFGIAGGARGVAERDCLPFVRRKLPFEIGLAAIEKGLVLDIADEVATVAGCVIDIDDIRLVLKLVERGLHRRREFTIGQQNPGTAVFQLERDRIGVEANIEPVNHRARHRDRVMCLKHRRHVR